MTPPINRIYKNIESTNVYAWNEMKWNEMKWNEMNVYFLLSENELLL